MIYWADINTASVRYSEIATEYEINLMRHDGLNVNYMPYNVAGETRWLQIQTKGDTMSKRICMDCQTVMGNSPNAHDTHGLCKPCKAKRMREIDRIQRNKLLDVQRRINSGFHDSDIPAVIVAEAIMGEVKNETVR